MEEGEIKKCLDSVYAIGFKNGQIEMKNKVLKKINRDWSLVTIHKPMDLIIAILKSVQKIRYTKDFTKVK
jgi:hypothetical protein